MSDLSPDELKARMGEADRGGFSNTDLSISLTVDHIRQKSPETRLALLRAVYEGENEVADATYKEILGPLGAANRWGTGRVSPYGEHQAGPLVCHAVGAPPARFDRVGRPQLDWAAMRFIVAAHENFEFLLELAEEGLKARKRKVSA